MKKSFFALLLWFFTLPALAENTILVLGDSLSAGYGIDPKQGWVSLLNQKLTDENYDYRVINDSVSGDTTRNGLDKLPFAIKNYQPDILIIELGGNDGLRGINLSIIKENLEEMISIGKQAKSRILVLGVRLPPNYGKKYTQQFQAIYIDLSKTNKDITVIPNFLNTVDDNPTLMQKDGIHPTQNAQNILLNNVWTELEKILSEDIKKVD